MARLIRMDGTGHTTLAEWTAADDAAMFGDELALAELMTADYDDMPEMLMLGHGGKGKSLPQRAWMVMRIMSAGKGAAEQTHVAHCEVAAQLANTIGFDESIQTGLW